MKSVETKVIPFRNRDRRRDELEFLPAALEIIETPASPAGRAIGATIIAFMILAIAWASLSYLDIVATASGRIVPIGSTKIIQPFETGVVRTIAVKEGQSVKAGDVLIELDPTADDADVRRLSGDLLQDRLDIARLSALLNTDLGGFAAPSNADNLLIVEARHQMEEQAAQQDAKLVSIDRQIDQKSLEIDEAKATIAKSEAVLPILQDQRDIREKVMENQYGSRLQFLQVEQQYVEQQHQLPVEQRRLDEATQALAELVGQRTQAQAEYRRSLFSDLAKAKIQAADHQEEMVKATERRSLQSLRAPLDGSVQQLSIHTVGGVVSAAQQLMVIVPREAPLEIEATLANKDIGFVHIGQAVEIKVETFNFTRYGLLHGTVTDISHDVTAPDIATSGRGETGVNSTLANDDAARQALQPSYVVHISLKQTGIRTEEGFTELEPGMAVTTEIKTGQRRVISYLLSPLLKYQNDAGRER